VDARAQAADSALSCTPRFEKRRVVGNDAAESRLVAGDNLPALEWLRGEFEGRFRCIYLDPPFNTGRRFAEYDDARTPDAWRRFLGARLAALRGLLAEDGAVFLEIDDSELGAAIGLCDEVFGRACRVSIITLVRSASTGHKARNRGPVNVSDFILVYERAPGAWRCRPYRRARRDYDRAYRTFLVNPDAPDAEWTFEPLARRVAGHLGHTTTRAARRVLGDVAVDAATAAFALRHRRNVVRFAQVRYEAVSHAARAAVDESRRDPERVFRLRRAGFPDLVLRGGNRILFLSSKVVDTEDGPRIVEPLTNVWDDVPFQGIAREGGVVFSRNKKPERLIERVLDLATDVGDWVLDPFLGSGTTAAVAEKMGRRWVGIEQGDVLRSLAIPRLTRVVTGADATGIAARGAHPDGGGFSLYA
jgi:adenine-specific DNA-methyltransferase